ncbi:ectoine/hydroxyectoine ABC transporter substrate-binding protein EhuB [Rhodoligotrophos defluvii]|uniref:ectoine/hydroxyectoine ABC transporter substrate-binding protein EhuB n=1 Tax=Rhodoligotrophos defluvii TaxID=2561934 RepID=UPI001EF014AB|nr:ectoine/hydroxyectoine ABC transporter substrate-binding protein EhuB [Rhodoligotrophos defluvii]
MKTLYAAARWTGLAVAVVLLTAPNTATVHADDLAAIKERGYVRGVTANEKPYGYIDSEGKGAGIGPDVAAAVLAKLGIEKIEWTAVAFDGLIPGVKANRFDFSAAEQAIRPERCTQVQFSAPTSSYTGNLLVKAGNPKNLRSYKDIVAKPGTKLAVIAGGTERLLDAYNIPQSDRVYLKSNADAIPALISGRADAYHATELTNYALAKLSPEVEVAEMTRDPVIDGKPYRNYGAFTFRKEDKDFYTAFNAELIAFKKTDAYEKILTSYGLTRGSVEAAREASTEALCAGK